MEEETWRNYMDKLMEHDGTMDWNDLYIRRNWEIVEHRENDVGWAY